MPNADLLRVFLMAFLIAISLLAMFYLRRRPLTGGQFLFWGMLALLVPALGPFLAIACRPGGSARRPRIERFTRR